VNRIKIIKNFTLLELLIAVLILVIISSIIVGVFQTTLKNYKKGMSYNEISESLSGSFMVMESDLNRMLPLGDKKTTFFKKDSFSFIAINQNEKKKSYLELIRYKFEQDRKKLYRAVVKYPDEKKDIDTKNITFFDGLQELKFSYTFSKSKDKKDDKKKSESNSNNNFRDSESDEEKSNNTESKIKTDKDKKDETKRPTAVRMSGRAKNKIIEEDFTTAFFVTSIEAVKSDTGTETDTDDKKNSDSGNI